MRAGTLMASFAAVLVAAAITGNGLAPQNPTQSPTPNQSQNASRGPDGDRPLPVTLASATLTTFSDCEELASWYRQAALEHVRPWGLEHYGGMVRLDGADGGGTVVASRAEGAGAQGAGGDAAPTPALQAGTDYSVTNVQEQGIDEPDMVKTDGRLAAVAANNTVHIVDVSGAGPERLATVELDEAWGSELLLDGDRLLVLTRGGGPPIAEPRTDGALSDPHHHRPHTRLTLYDLADPTAPELVTTLELEGDYVTARMVDGVARVVLRSQATGPSLLVPHDEHPIDEEELVERHRDTILGSDTQDWIPSYRLRPADGEPTVAPLVDCGAAVHPETFTGFGMLTVLSVDLGDDMIPTTGASIAADGHTVYASRDHLYIALNRWVENADEIATDIHQFDISDPATARHLASGSVPGQLLNQWALSEHAGHLRVATTQRSTSVAADSVPDTDSAVRVLARSGDELVLVGEVDGLGEEGERIYAVRYMGDVGYVVTFRETDPLYTLDLSDPASPRVLGELKIPGYSSYLHPIGDGLLLGIGQEADTEGRLLGLQASVFDVSDLRSPRQLHKTVLGGSSAAEYDHRAFLWWAPRSLAVVPYDQIEWREPDGYDGFLGALALRVGADGIAELGRIGEPLSGTGHDDEPWRRRTERSLVVGDLLYTVGQAGMRAYALDTLSPVGEVEF